MLKTTKKGFTIIEVVIVLVIGAVIMLGVFLVVPGLQRSAQNQRCQDIARQILAGIEQFKANNQGKSPSSTDIPAIKTQIGTKALTDPNGAVTDIITPGAPTKVTVASFRDNTKCEGDKFATTSSPGSTAVMIALSTQDTTGAGTPFQTYCISN
jgi:prepilin-type N-terminal cleavage/methylation domain-containing protein